MPDYRKMVEELFLAPARGWVAQSPEAPMQRLKNEGGLLGELAYSLDPVSAFGGYGGLAAMASPMGAAKPQTLRAYHGTNQVFDKFGPGHVYMTPDPKIASRYADPAIFAPSQRHNAKPNVLPLDATFENPLVIDMKGKSGHWKEQFAGGDVFEAAKRGGHDGIILKNMRDIFADTPQTQYIAVKPGTVKSAITGETLFGGLGAMLGLDFMNDAAR